MKHDFSPAFRFTAMIAATFAAILAAFVFGPYPMSPEAVLQALLAGPQAGNDAAVVVWRLRLPRIDAALLVGAALSTAGALFQGIFRNPLASPGILGVSSGAGLGAALAIYCGMPLLLVQGAAFGGGLAALSLVAFIAWQVRGHDPVLVLVLAGVCASALFSAGISLVKVLADPTTQLASITFWLLGGLNAIHPGDLVFAGPLSTPAGGEVVLISQSYGNLRFQGDTQGMRIKQMTLGESAYIYIENPNALTNAMKIYFELGWGAFRKIQNNTGAPLVFATTNLSITTGWSCPRVCFYGAPFLFPQGTFVWSPRADDNSMDADFAIRDLVLLKHDGDSRFVKRGAGIFSVTNATIYSDDAQKNYVRVYEGCYFPRTDAAWAPSRQVFIESSNGTVGLNEDYYPMMNASHAHRVLGINTANAWGFTAFGGDRVVCYNNDPSFAVTNRSTGGSNANFTDTTTVAQLDPTKKLSAYYAWPQRFVFGNRSPMADGTILFKNPMEQLLNEDQYTYFESTNRVVAVRLQGKINVGHRDRTWYFDGRSVGGCGAVEADNTNFIGRVNVRNLATLLVNGPLEARSVTVATTSGLGGTNRVGGAEGVTVQTGGTIFGGEYGRGGSLTVDSALTMQANALLRADIPADPAAGIGYVKLVTRIRPGS